MNKQEFLKETKQCVNIAIQRSNQLLRLLSDVDVRVDWNYDFEEFDDTAIGVYVNQSVFTGTIEIGMNLKQLYNSFKWQIEHYNTDEYTILREIVMTNVYHEVGHGIVEQINDWLQTTDDLDEIYDENEQLFDKALDNEEDTVEQFAWCFYDNNLENSRLYKIIQLVRSIYV